MRKNMSGSTITTLHNLLYRVFQNWRTPNSKRGREGPSGARKILRKKNSLFLKKIQALEFCSIHSSLYIHSDKILF
jgi:hypothetical protein